MKPDWFRRHHFGGDPKRRPAPDKGAGRSASPGDIGRGALETLSGQRRVVLVLMALMIIIPLTMLAIRVDDPRRGQIPFGWQMHTTCWGSDADVCD